MSKNTDQSIFDRISNGFFKMNMSFSLPDRHEQIFSLIARDHAETPLYFKSTNYFSTCNVMNLKSYFKKLDEKDLPYSDLLEDIHQIGDQMISMERTDILKQLPFFLK